MEVFRMLTAADILTLTSKTSTLSSENALPPLFFVDLRIYLKLTQAQMAQKLGVSPTTINNWETGRSQPYPAMRYRMEKRLGISPDMTYRMFPPRPSKRSRAAREAA
jgi:DNA-binding XRE family transcriptional regulator